jgi:hypothetical protein
MSRLKLPLAEYTHASESSAEERQLALPTLWHVEEPARPSFESRSSLGDDDGKSDYFMREVPPKLAADAGARLTSQGSQGMT